MDHMPAGSSAARKMPKRPDAARYQAIVDRDVRAEGTFVYAVNTTGVYCRPTCGARLPLARNVQYYGTAAEAERAGFRPCKRCRPREALVRPHALAVSQARAALEAADGPIALDTLAAQAGLSPHHFHRVFKRQVGLTPRDYAAACRLQRFGQAVAGSASVTEAIYEAGYSSSGRFYEAGRALGLAPATLRRGAEGVRMRATVRPTRLGHMLVAATERGVCAVLFGQGEASLRRALRARFPRAEITPATSDGALEALATQVVALVEGAGLPATADLPLDLLGTAFQQRVWRALRDIPPGSTATYGDIARRIGSPGAVRAVGTACGANPVAVLVPCHRVLRGDGKIGGYRWGPARKRALLARERKPSPR